MVRIALHYRLLSPKIAPYPFSPLKEATVGTIRWFIKISYLHQVFAAAFGTWVIAVLSNGPDPFTTKKIAAGAAMGLGVLGAFLFHRGAANRMYARKKEVVPNNHPVVLVYVGAACMIAGFWLTAWKLPMRCTFVTAFNCITIVLYSRFLCKHWMTKNITMGVVCSTPIIFGWWTGTHNSPIIPYALGVAFLAFISKEMTKDIDDIAANEGLRITLPIRFGIKGAARAACVTLVCSIIVALNLCRMLPQNAYALVPMASGLAILIWVAWRLLNDPAPGRLWHAHNVGIWLLIVSVCVAGINK